MAVHASIDSMGCSMIALNACRDGVLVDLLMYCDQENQRLMQITPQSGYPCPQIYQSDWLRIPSLKAARDKKHVP